MMIRMSNMPRWQIQYVLKQFRLSDIKAKDNPQSSWPKGYTPLVASMINNAARQGWPEEETENVCQFSFAEEEAAE